MKDELIADGILEICWHGRGGQGVVTASKLLAETALEAGYFFQAFPDYGPERMGAPIRAFTRLSRRPIHLHAQISQADLSVVLDETVMRVINVADGLKPDGWLIVNTQKTPEQIRESLGESEVRIFTVNASRAAIQYLKRDITNTPMLGALAAVTGLFDPEQIAEQIRRKLGRKFGPEVAQANISAFHEAASQIKEG